MSLEDEETFDDHPEEVWLNGVADVDETLAADLDDVEAHECDEVLDELGRL